MDASGTKPQPTAGLGADPTAVDMGPPAVPNPNTVAQLLPPESPAPVETVARRALQSIELALRQSRELQGGYATPGVRQPPVTSDRTITTPWQQ